ncbi:hypothetical protein I315_03185 [Cryptococcus gattii Ru294]|uniref:Uncharacterized protein n=1 Tax=Cryptococcus gattii EJB2 TaxID=1296103 RepID=A0ABR5BWA9_9TREE|nr:hypothetical protein I315_03185 [Cryptococcus gattii Ru294]KIR79925.1 hypothetical protein I306_02887 [Cryptococcus gattii EJB2]KJE05208.1 hypothetical protein I311_00885 [Cryptococcus gattii NT-10]
MSNFQRLVPAFLAVTAGIATGYYVVAPEYAPGGAGAEVIPPEQRKNTPVPPISSSSAFDKVSPPMTANAGQKDLLEDKALSTDSFGTLSGGASQTGNFRP